MEDKEKKTDISKVYFEGDWQKEDGIVWAFFESGEKKEKEPLEKEKEKEKEKETEKKEIKEVIQSVPKENIPKQVISITDIGKTVYDPRYKKVEIPVEIKTLSETEKEKKEPGKEIIQLQKEARITVTPPEDSAAKVANIMAQSQKKFIQDLKKKENLTKIRSVIYDLGMYGFSFFSLMFDKETSITESNFKKIGKMLEYDPALALKIIQVANSAYYCLPKKVFSISKALNVLGVEKARGIVTKATPSIMFKNIKKTDLFKHLWYHSLGTGVFCKILAHKIGLDEDEMFMMGMMHDLGKVILYVSLTEEYKEVIKKIKENMIIFRDAEKEILGYDHCEVGKIAMETWELPQQLINAARYHHDLEMVQHPHLQKQIAVVQAADVLCNLSKITTIGTKKIQLFDKKTKIIIGNLEIPKLTEKALCEIKEIEILLKSE